MPELIIGESLDKWLERCIPAMIQEGKAQDQALAACTSMHEQFSKFVTAPANTPAADSSGSTIAAPEGAPVININIGSFKLETREIKNVEILHAGRFKGVDYAAAELDQFIENFTNQVAEPVLTIDHDESLTGKVAKEFKVAALGYVSALKRVGDKLYADFKQVPKLIADLIEAGPLKQRSVEFFKTFKTSAGKVLKNVLTGVTFFGSGLPAVSGMSDLMNFFKSETMANGQCDDEIKSESIEVFKVEDTMADQMPPAGAAPAKVEEVTIPKSEYDNLLAIVKEYNDMKKESDPNAVKCKDDQIESFKKETEELKVKLESANKAASEFEAFKAEALKTEAESYVSGQIQGKKLLPKFKDMKVADYIRLKSDNAALELFKSEIEQRADVIPENFLDVSTPQAEEFKSVEDAGPAYEKLITQGKTHAEALAALGII